MTQTTISLRIEKELHQQMRKHTEIDWRKVLRSSILQQLKKNRSINVERARKAARDMDRMRQLGIFAKGKSTVELIREWREKRK